jgi:hypothetical protein
MMIRAPAMDMPFGPVTLPRSAAVSGDCGRAPSAPRTKKTNTGQQTFDMSLHGFGIFSSGMAAGAGTELLEYAIYYQR